MCLVRDNFFIYEAPNHVGEPSVCFCKGAKCVFCVGEPSVCGFQVCGEPSVCGSQVCVWCKGAKCVWEPSVWGTQMGGASKWVREPKVWGSQMCVVSKCSREPKVCEAKYSQKLTYYIPST